MQYLAYANHQRNCYYYLYTFTPSSCCSIIQIFLCNLPIGWLQFFQYYRVRILSFFNSGFKYSLINYKQCT